MIAYIEGVLTDFGEKSCLIVTPGGVGYELSMPTSALAGLPAKGETAKAFVHTVVREDAIELFGFLSLDDRDLFRTLISIDKLGPRKALAILSHFTPDHLREIALREDDSALATVPGIGPKSAKQILWFLKDKVAKLATRSSGVSGKSGKARRPADDYLDALAGLKNLGYSEDEARPLLKEIFEAEPDLEAPAAIRAALKRIAAARS